STRAGREGDDIEIHAQPEREGRRPGARLIQSRHPPEGWTERREERDGSLKEVHPVRYEHLRRRYPVEHQKAAEGLSPSLGHRVWVCWRGRVQSEDHEQEPHPEATLLLLCPHLVQCLAACQPHAGEEVLEVPGGADDTCDNRKDCHS